MTGTLPRPFAPDSTTTAAWSAVIDGTRARWPATIAFVEPPEANQANIGFVAHVPAGTGALERCEAICLDIDDVPYEIGFSPHYRHRARAELLTDVVTRLRRHGRDNAGTSAMLALLEEQLGATRPHMPSATPAEQAPAVTLQEVLVGIDETIVCPGNAIVIRGWMLGEARNLTRLMLRCGERSTPIDLATSVRFKRPELLASDGRNDRWVPADCGFMAFLPDAFRDGMPLSLEAWPTHGSMQHLALKRSTRDARSAIELILGIREFEYGDIDRAFDQTIGPALFALHEAVRAEVVSIRRLDFGTACASPSHTLVIPLYGRIDFIEYQMALLSADPVKETLEIIYVLDDPRFADSIARLATSVYARLGIAFTVLVCDRNTGFARASNQGLAVARAPHVCFMNSDVFPLQVGWLDRLSTSLRKTAGCGAIGPRLLYEDGSVQHDGCAYQAIPEYGDWQFVDHPGKGLRPTRPTGVVTHPAITGACMLMTRDLALQLNGFDERYLVGDFEDSDLCRRMEVAGRTCGVDTRVTAMHAERQSQASAETLERRNLTLYNAWLHQRRWFGTPGAKPGTNAVAAPAAKRTRART